MKLKYDLGPGKTAALMLMEDEEIWYSVPCDLFYNATEKKAEDVYTKDFYLVVTNKRFITLEGEKIVIDEKLTDCEKIKCEHQVHSGIVVITRKNGKEICAARFSMRDIVRVSYVARGAQTIIEAYNSGCTPNASDKVVSHEFEKYCEKCGRALPGTSRCPRCDGKGTMFKKFMVLCNGYAGKFLLISFLMIFNATINMVNPIVQKNYIDGALKSGNGTMTDLWRFVICTLVLMITQVILAVYRSLTCAKLGASLSMSLRTRLYYKIQSLSLSFINKRKPGELMNRVTRDTRRIRVFIEEVFGDMFSSLITMIVSVVMMLTISVKMTVLCVALDFTVVLLARGFWHYVHMIFHRQGMKQDELSSSLQDILSGMRIVKTFGKEKNESAKFNKISMEYADLSTKNESFWSLLIPVVNFFLGAGTYIAIYFGGVDVLEGEMTIGQLLQFITYCGYFLGPLGWMTHLPKAFLDMLTSMNRIYDVLDEESELKESKENNDFQIKGDFEFNNVSFGYQSYEPVLENINFNVKAGEMIGLVGASGAGKSTLINLIMRLYDTDRGSIKIDGTDIKEISSQCLHSQIGVVLQETFLFSGSILANIKFAKPDATLEEVIKAAKAANAHDFICKTPDGYNTYVGEHGYNLSGGERQRISIARAILNDPKLLILDEATSALDTESEYLIQQALNRLTKDRTTFAIAHRLSTLREADRLVVIDKHGVAEIGTHNELLEKKGIYYGLVTAQLQMAEGK